MSRTGAIGMAKRKTWRDGAQAAEVATAIAEIAATDPAWLKKFVSRLLKEHGHLLTKKEKMLT
jgi:hypothetical protein